VQYPYYKDKPPSTVVVGAIDPLHLRLDEIRGNGDRVPATRGRRHLGAQVRLPQCSSAITLSSFVRRAHEFDIADELCHGAQADRNEPRKCEVQRPVATGYL
jgi:hypothetical protein